MRIECGILNIAFERRAKNSIETWSFEMKRTSWRGSWRRRLNQ
jgi:hypothetical protein